MSRYWLLCDTHHGELHQSQVGRRRRRLILACVGVLEDGSSFSKLYFFLFVTAQYCTFRMEYIMFFSYKLFVLQWRPEIESFNLKLAPTIYLGVKSWSKVVDCPWSCNEDLLELFWLLQIVQNNILKAFPQSNSNWKRKFFLKRKSISNSEGSFSTNSVHPSWR